MMNVHFADQVAALQQQLKDRDLKLQTMALNASKAQVHPQSQQLGIVMLIRAYPDFPASLHVAGSSPNPHAP